MAQAAPQEYPRLGQTMVKPSVVVIAKPHRKKSDAVWKGNGVVCRRRTVVFPFPACAVVDGILKTITCMNGTHPPLPGDGIRVRRSREPASGWKAG